MRVTARPNSFVPRSAMEASEMLKATGQSNENDKGPVSDQEKKELCRSWRMIKLQFMSCSIISFSMAHAGMTISFPNLLKTMGSELSSYYASLSALATPLGSLATSLLADRIGRKRTLITLQVLVIICWVGVTRSEDSRIFFYCSSVLAGITRGALTSHSATYISELAHGDYRQLLLSLTSVFFTLGYTTTSGVNLLLTWFEAGIGFAVIFSIVCALTAVLVPESPHWLGVLQLDWRRARNTMKKLNPSNEMFEKEWTLLQQKLDTSPTKPTGTRFALVRKHNVYKSGFILVVLLLFQQFCGIYPLSAYTVYVLPAVSSTLGVAYTSEIFAIIGCVRLLVSLITTGFLSRFNQKQLLSFSAVGMMLLAIPLAGIKAVAGDGDAVSLTDWILVVCLVAYTAVSCVGAVGVPWTIIFELLPTEVRGLLGPHFVAFGYIVMSGVLWLFPVALKLVGIIYVFAFFGLVNLAGSLFVHFYVPETRGKSLYEIENHFNVKAQKNQSNC